MDNSVNMKCYCGTLKKDDKILFVKHRKKGEEYYLLPGGGVDFGETFETALKREFLEEVNINISVDKLCIISEGVDPKGEKHIINLVFLVDYVSGEIVLPDEERIVGIEYLEVTNLNNYIIYPNIKKELKKNSFDNISYLGNIWE